MPANKKTKVQCKIIAMRIAFVYAGSCLALSSTLIRLVEPMPRTIAVAMAGKMNMKDLAPYILAQVAGGLAALELFKRVKF